jgi:cell division protein FtsQ
MSPVAAPNDRRFRRAHLKPARRRGPWRSLLRSSAKYGLLSFAALGAGYYGGTAVVHAGVLRIDQVIVRGNARLSTGEVLAALDGLRGENIVWADLREWRERLQSSPWVRDAAFRRSLPSTIRVTLTEREPIAIARLAGELYLIDESGNVMDEYGPRYADFDLPLVDGIAERGRAGQVADPSRAGLAAEVIAALQTDQEIARQLSQVNVADANNAAVLLAGDPALLYVGRERFLSRVRSYLQLAPTLRARVPEIDSVDLRFDDRMYVRPSRVARRPGAGASTREHAGGGGASARRVDSNR